MGLSISDYIWGLVLTHTKARRNNEITSSQYGNSRDFQVIQSKAASKKSPGYYPMSDTGSPDVISNSHHALNYHYVNTGRY